MLLAHLISSVFTSRTSDNYIMERITIIVYVAIRDEHVCLRTAREAAIDLTIYRVEGIEDKIT
jgi:hypothetical protein